jgi:integrase
VLKAMQPEADWRWLMDLTNRLNTWARPSVDRTAQTLPIERIHNASLRELDRLQQTPLVRRIDRVAYRDALIMLVLSAAPVRLRNLAMIEIGTHLHITGSSATLRFNENETKNRQRLTHPLPRHLLPYLQVYLDRIRPSFGTRGACDRLWLGFEGRPLTAHSIYGRVLLTSQRLLGVKINPHSFRACAATSLADRSSTDALVAGPLLGHRYFSTTERHYIRALQMEASRKVHTMLADIQRNSGRD